MNTQEVICKCGCGRKKVVRTADIKRGWGLYFSKSCKAKSQSRRFGGRKRDINTLIKSFHAGHVSEEYAAYTVLKSYPDCVGKLLRETGIDAITFDDHPHSSEALGQW